MSLNQKRKRENESIDDQLNTTNKRPKSEIKNNSDQSNSTNFKELIKQTFSPNPNEEPKIGNQMNVQQNQYGKIFYLFNF